MNPVHRNYMSSSSRPGNTRVNLSNFLSCSLLLLILQVPTITHAAADSSCQITESDLATASGVVSQLHDTLLSVMKDADKLGYSGRYKILEPVITNNFNTPLITRTILGSRYWNTMSEQQKNDFIDLFRKLSIATYADRFDGFNGEKFVEIGRRPLPVRGKCPPPPGREPPAQRILIKTELQRVQDDNVKLEYLLQKMDDKWYIITVIADGVNDLSLKRGEYTDVIRHSGFAGLTDELKTKIQNMENGTE